MRQTCKTCGENPPKTKGRCPRCYAYFTRNGSERPVVDDLRTAGSQRGEDHYAWKGDAATRTTKRERCRAIYELGSCELCDADATERHHKDDDTGNNDLTNIQFLCRRCHMVVDGRLEALKALAAENARRSRKGPRECRVCKSVGRLMSHGRCHACDTYWRNHGMSSERSEILGLTGADLARWRNGQGLNKSEAARVLGVDRGTVHRGEKRAGLLSAKPARALRRAIDMACGDDS